MAYQARLDGTKIVMVVEAADARDGWAAVGGPIDWQARPSIHHYPHLIQGAVVWQDTRTVPGALADKWQEIRSKRDAILRDSDWRPIYAADRGGQAAADWAKSPWRDYRQALRNVTNQGDPFSITWPTPPAE